ncbi:ribbon-helix-helix domain-containing protein [Acinetobacter sp. ANC 3832]|uniref:ribbon-helix-helix domain-containing protein n=1 Tax=Acinetobacter sp. ANC 3832 TaxID=1977874 RepID=UPI000A32DA19|nr:ribbon-helix-helix domain-containing protein [Acinetobacter sp. ANC 3832]OTG87225.1 hypothetical protein B9T35_17880 [Acinetobacter sp. ANC 3832]
MNTIHEDFLTDTKSTPVKVHLPNKLVEQVNEFCEATKQSKSEVIRDCLIQGLNNSPQWTNRRFFFPSRLTENSEKIQNFFKNPPINTLVKLAANHINNPSSAYMVMGYFQKIVGDEISVYVPPFPIQHFGLSNAIQELVQISTTQSKVVIPDVEMTLNAWLQNEVKVIYTLPIDYVWDFYQ